MVEAVTNIMKKGATMVKETKDLLDGADIPEVPDNFTMLQPLVQMGFLLYANNKANQKSNWR